MTFKELSKKIDEYAQKYENIRYMPIFVTTDGKIAYLLDDIVIKGDCAILLKGIKAEEMNKR